ncbi:MAG: substrate-binding domain-containing protein [Pseudomonadota bacterium]
MPARDQLGGASSEDVARLAGVSRSTVSRTFTPGTPVSPRTRVRVMEAAAQLGYRHATHRAERPESRTVGLIMGALDNPFYQNVLAGFLGELHKRGLRVMCREATSPQATEAEVMTMLDHEVDAMVVASSGLRSTAIDECAAAGVPVVLFNRAVDGVTAASVQTDNRAGGHTVAELLVRTGHRRIAFINGLERASTNRDRLSGFAERLAELGAAPPIQEYGEYTFEGGREAAKRLMMRTEAPDAIFVANDISALGALEGLRRDLGIKVPETVSVVGFDDIPMASWPSFDLTTVRQRRNRMIAIAMDRIDAILAGTDSAPERELVEGRLILRSSVRLSARADLTTA